MEISKVFDAIDSIDEWDGRDPIQTNLNPSKDTIEISFQWSNECQSLVQSLNKGWREGVQIKCSGEYDLLYDRLLRITSKQEITNSKGGGQPDKMFRQAERMMWYDSERFQWFNTIQDPRPAIPIIIQCDFNNSIWFKSHAQTFCLFPYGPQLLFLPIPMIFTIHYKLCL